MPVTNYYTVDSDIIGEHTVGQSRLDYMPDALGSVVGTVDQTLTVQGTARYKPSGTSLSTTGTQAQFGWIGRPGYRATGLPHSDFYVRMRHDGSTEGRWTTLDLLWPFESAFGYVKANPTTLIDRSGLASCSSKSPRLPHIDIQHASPCVRMAAIWIFPPSGSRATIFHDCERMMRAQYDAKQRLGDVQPCPNGYWEICKACVEVTGLPVNCGSKPGGGLPSDEDSDNPFKSAIRGCLKKCLIDSTKEIKDCLKECGIDKISTFAWGIAWCLTHKDQCAPCKGGYMCDCKDDDYDICLDCVLAEWARCLAMDPSGAAICKAKADGEGSKCLSEFGIKKHG